MRLLIPVLFSIWIAFSAPCAESIERGFSPAEKEELQGLRQISQTFRAVARKVRPAVVHLRCVLPQQPLGAIRSESPESGDDNSKTTSIGSGVIFDPNGFILTSYHVVLFAEEIQVFLEDRREFEAQLISFDTISDLAVLRIDARNLPTVELGDSETAEVGDWVLAIGSPFGLQQTVTAGIISATGRDFSSGEDNPYVGYQNFIQTDAVIYSGSSGGPLLNLDGEVIGITHNNMAMAIKHKIVHQYKGLSFATPINFAKNVLKYMKQGYAPQRAYLDGVGLLDVDAGIAEAANLDRIYGAQVQFVKRNSSAERAKLRTGDIILACGDTEIRNKVHLRGLIACADINKEITLVILRDGQEQQLRFKPEPGEVIAEDTIFGFSLINLTRPLADIFGSESTEGALIYSVKQGGKGRRIGLVPGMIIVSINGMNIPDINAYSQAAKRFSLDEPILFVVKYQNSIKLIRLLPRPREAKENADESEE
ncbi:MAG: trypsin-like peptidase domain-containing protein [Planctomycetes bacterium]|nr:trypsin-like peptidase domain-containing protein [Planctomycetota bacterium]